MINFDAISIRTSTERPEAIDSGSIVLGGIEKSSVLKSIDAVKMFGNRSKNLHRRIPLEYQIENTSEIVIRCIMSYHKLIDKFIWNK